MAVTLASFLKDNPQWVYDPYRNTYVNKSTGQSQDLSTAWLQDHPGSLTALTSTPSTPGTTSTAVTPPVTTSLNPNALSPTPTTSQDTSTPYTRTSDSGGNYVYDPQKGSFTDVTKAGPQEIKSPYAGLQGYLNAYANAAGKQSSTFKSEDRLGLASRLNAMGDQFKTLFTNTVGRAPTQDEVNKFFNEGVQQGGLSPEQALDPQQVRNGISQFVSDSFQPEAQSTAQTKLQDLSGQAGTLADQFQSMGEASLKGLSNDLADYQTRLFDKLRPQLSLAAQAGGYADSGGKTLQEQGALKDLATQAEGVLTPLRYDLNTKANAIRYGGASDPYSLSRSFAINQPDILANYGANALATNNATFGSNLDFAHQIDILNRKAQLLNDQQPSMLGRIGNSFADKFGEQSGNIAANNAQAGLKWLAR